MKVLFVGGPRNGKREEVPDNIGFTFKTAAYKPNYKAYPVADFSETMNVREDIYRIHCVDGVNFAVHTSVKNFAQRLFNGYPYPRKRRY
jgi:hypothetical protein